MASRRSGNLVITKVGKKGLVYNDESPINGKHRVYVVNSEMVQSGEKLLVSADNLKVIGFID